MNRIRRRWKRSIIAAVTGLCAGALLTLTGPHGALEQVAAGCVMALALVVVTREQTRPAWYDREELRRGRTRIRWADITDARVRFRGTGARVVFTAKQRSITLSTAADDVTAAEVRSLIRRCRPAVVGKALGADL